MSNSSLIHEKPLCDKNYFWSYYPLPNILLCMMFVPVHLSYEDSRVKSVDIVLPGVFKNQQILCTKHFFSSSEFAIHCFRRENIKFN